MSDNPPGEVAEAQVPALGVYQGAAHLLIARAMQRLEEGDTAGFQEDVIATLKLARLVAQGWTVIEQLMAYRIDGLAHEAVQRAAGADLLDGATVGRLATALAALPEMPSLERCFDHSERYRFLDTIGVISQRGPNRIPWFALWEPGSEDEVRGYPALRAWRACEPYLEPLNCNSMMRAGNTIFDDYKRALAEPTYGRRLAMLRAVESDTFASRDQGLFLHAADHGVGFAMSLIPSLGRVDTYLTQAGVEADLSALALQFRLYKIDHGVFPDDLAALGLATAALNDRFSDRPLVYRREGVGYVLYSVGPDGKDDGGRTREEDVKHMGRWDIVVRAEK